MLKKQLFLLEFFPPHLQLAGWEMGWDMVNRYLEMIIEQQQQYKQQIQIRIIAKKSNDLRRKCDRQPAGLTARC